MGEIARPLFFEGQILAARDLQESVDYGRGKDQRHNRLLHRWGIASGLELRGESRIDADDNEYLEVFVGSGLAVDGNGRELLLDEEVRLSPDLFRTSTVEIEDPTAWYPVYLQGLDRNSASSGGVLSVCASGGGLPTRAMEEVELVFGRPGVQADLPPVPDLGDETSGEPWPVLIGFVRWSGDALQFTEIADSADGSERRYVGVYADVVESLSGTLELRTEPSSEVGGLALRIDDKQLRFGVQNGKGAISNLFSVNDKGEATAGGKPIGGGVRTASGLLQHGMLIPLPANVEEDAVASGAVTLHIDVTPHLDFPNDAGVTVALPMRCVVTAERRLECIWVAVPGGIQPGVARYTVTASSAAPPEAEES